MPLSSPKSDLAEKLFLHGYACSQAILLAFANETGLDERQAKLIAAPFGGGMGRLRLTCGALSGAFMVLGLKYGNEQPKDLKRKYSCYELVQDLAKKFVAIHGSTECGVLLKNKVSLKEIEQRKHHQKICHILVRDVAILLEEILAKDNHYSHHPSLK